MADPAEHPARLLLRQGQGRDSATAPARSRRRRRTKPGRRSGTDRAGEIPGDHLGRRRRDGRRNRGMQGARRTARRAGRQQLPAQRLVPGEPSAVVRPARLPAEGGDEAAVARGRRDRARLAPRAVRHAAAARDGLLAEGREDHPDRRRSQDARPREEDLGRHLRRREGRGGRARATPRRPHARVRRARARRSDRDREGRVGEGTRRLDARARRLQPRHDRGAEAREAVQRRPVPASALLREPRRRCPRT